MKLKFALVIILTLLIIGCGIGQIVMVNKSMDYISAELEELKGEIQRENFDVQRVYGLEEYWQRILPVLEIIIPNNEIDQVGMLLAELKGAIENEDKKETHIRIEVLQIRVESIKHLLGFRIEHII